MSKIPIRYQYFVEKERNNSYAWGMFSAMVLLFCIYGLLINWLPKYLRKRRREHQVLYRRHLMLLRCWKLFNGTFRVKVRFLGAFYIQCSVLVIWMLYILWLGMMCWGGTSDIDYEPQFYIVGKRVGKVAVGEMPLLMLFILKNDLLTTLFGWPAHSLTLLHMWMGRLIYAMMIVHVVLTTKYWIDLNYLVMIVIPPQIIGMIAFGSMSMLFLLSPRLIRRLSYEFFLFNHGFFSFIMFLAAFLHSNSAKAGVLLAVHVLAIDRVALQVRAGLNYWSAKPVSSRATYELLDPTTIRITIPLTVKKVTLKGRTIMTVGTWKPGQHVYVKVGKARKLEWHPFTISSLSDSRNMVILMKVYKGFTKSLRKVVATEAAKSEATSCELKTWLHGPYGATIAPLIEFDSVLFIAGGTGASFTFPLALDLLRNMCSGANVRCKRMRFVWYTRTHDSLKWYETCISGFETCLSEQCNVSVQIEIFITGKAQNLLEEDNQGCNDLENPFEKLRKSLSYTESSQSSLSLSPSINIESGKQPVHEIIESEMTEGSMKVAEEGFLEAAVLACGPTALVNEVAFEAERQERKIDKLSVYQYMEKYIV